MLYISSGLVVLLVTLIVLVGKRSSQQLLLSVSVIVDAVFLGCLQCSSVLVMTSILYGLIQQLHWSKKIGIVMLSGIILICLGKCNQRYIFDLQQWLSLVAYPYLSIQRWVCCIQEWIFLHQPRKRKERCGMYLWYSEKAMANLRVWNSLPRNWNSWGGVSNVLCPTEQDGRGCRIMRQPNQGWMR